MAWTSGAAGPVPLVPLKLTSVVRVCAGEATGVAAQHASAMQTIFEKLSFAHCLLASFRCKEN